MCVYCGARPGARPEYEAAAIAACQEIAALKGRLVYGGGRVGLMGTCADTGLAAGGEVAGVIPKALQAREVAHNHLSKLLVVDSMHERKQHMADLSDAFLALPGGFGTLDEMFEMVNWSYLGMHAKPVGLLNVAGYYDHLIAFIDHSVREGFVTSAQRALLVVGDDPRELVRKLAARVSK